MPTALPRDAFFTGTHTENIQKALNALTSNNAGYNVFIYYDWNVPSVKVRDSVFGFFKSKDPKEWFSYNYGYYVFSEGNITWSGSTKLAERCKLYQKSSLTSCRGDSVGMTTDNLDVDQYEYRFQRRDRVKVDWPNWLGQLRQQMDPELQSQLCLSSLTLPGTHNSHALNDNIQQWKYRVIKVANCQEVDISEQLKMGVRSLDLRIGGGGKLRHGWADLSGDLRDALNWIDSFLDDHPHETVMFQAKWDHNGADPPPTRAGAAEYVGQVVKEFSRGQVLSTQPKLSDCIGKMVLFNDNGEGAWQPSYVGGRAWPSTAQGSNDVEKQWDIVRQYLEWIPSNNDIRDGSWYTTYVSAQTLDNWDSWGKVLTGRLEATRPFKFADYVNPRVLDWFKDHPQAQRSGRIVLVFANTDLVHEIVLRNFDYFAKPR